MAAMGQRDFFLGKPFDPIPHDIDTWGIEVNTAP